MRKPDNIDFEALELERDRFGDNWDPRFNEDIGVIRGPGGIRPQPKQERELPNGK